MVFEEEVKRVEAVKAFYESFYLNLNREKEEIKDSVPFVILVDTNGYYVSYGAQMNNNGIVYTDVITPLNAWARDYKRDDDHHYVVQFYMGKKNTVSITDADGTGQISYEGYYDKVYNELGRPDALRFMSSSDKFEAERNEVLQDTIEMVVNHYLNYYNNLTNDTEKTYQVRIVGDNADGQRMLSQPTVMAFMQGANDELINVYGFVGTEVAKERLYTLGSDGYYHEQSCVSSGRKFTMEDCATKGYLPHICIR